MDKVFIKDLAARGIIGINEWEREKKQEILINITLETDIRRAAEADDIDFSVNYRTIAKQALAHAESAQSLTVEALATDIARISLSDPRVSKTIVKVEKPGAVRFSASVGVEIERTPSDFE
jgi:FolB domain-containing protein